MDLLNNATYLYGTAIFSSLTMISGHNAIKVLGVYATVAVVSRVIDDWVLVEIGGTGSKWHRWNGVPSAKIHLLHGYPWSNWIRVV